VRVRYKRSHKPPFPILLASNWWRVEFGISKSLKEEKLMKNMKQLLMNLMTEESGQDLIEYALVAALVGLGAVVSMKGLANSISNTFTAVGTGLDSAVA
jgi:pilus assembly protein Flp/PilA